MMPHPLRLALLAALLAGCADATPVVTIPMRDSAGVRVVEYASAPEATYTLELSPEPLFRYGHRPADEPFARIAYGVLLPQGGVAIADVGANPLAGQQILLIGEDGALRSVIARGGQGPTEVRQVGAMAALPPDTLIVQDRANRKLMWFQDTAFVRTLSTGTPELGPLSLQGVAGPGALLMSAGGTTLNFTEPWSQGTMLRVDVATLAVDTLGTYDATSNFPRERPRDVFTPYGRATTSGSTFVHARSDLAELVWRGPDGRVSQILRWVEPPRYATAEDEGRMLGSLAEDLARVNPESSPEEVAQMVERQRETMHFSLETPLPLFRELIGDGEGGVWLGEFHPLFGPFTFPPRYRVVRADGAWLGTLEMPERFRVLDVRGGRVLGVLVDELGVESVAVFELWSAPIEG